MTHLAQSEHIGGTGRARVCVGVIRVLVRLRAARVTGFASSSSAAGVARDNREAGSNEFRGRIEVDRGKIPVKGLTLIGVLELENAILAGTGGQLDGDTAAVGVGLPVLAVGAATRVDGLHVSRVLGGGPQVDASVQVVDDLNTSARSGGSAGASAGGCAGGVVASHVGTGHGSSGGSKNARNEDVGEKHLEKDCVL